VRFLATDKSANTPNTLTRLWQLVPGRAGVNLGKALPSGSGPHLSGAFLNGPLHTAMDAACAGWKYAQVRCASETRQDEQQGRHIVVRGVLIGRQHSLIMTTSGRLRLSFQPSPHQAKVVTMQNLPLYFLRLNTTTKVACLCLT